MSAQAAAPRADGRLAWVDWLKVVIVLGVFAYHAAQPYILTPWIVASDQKSLLLSASAGLGYLFGMPLMFVLAGAASLAALRGTTVASYVRGRLRLVVPLVLGLAILSPLQAWVGATTRGELIGPVPFAVRFWADAGPPRGPVWLGEHGFHLWFIGFLLAYALVSVPLLIRLRPDPSPMRPAAPWLAIVPITALVVTQVPLRVAAPAYRDWADLALWFAYFLAGAAMLARPRVLDHIGRHGLWLLVPGLLLAIPIGWLFADGSGFALESSPTFDAAGLGYIVLRTAVGACWVVVGLAIGRRWLNGRAEQAREASRLVLPFYVLHHPIVVVVAAVVVPLAWPVGLGFGVILGVSGAMTLAACLAVARTSTLRVLFGMGASRPDARPTTVSP
jgi:hypothetical protein